MSEVTIAGVISLIGVATTVASLSWLHLQPTGLSAVRNAVSQYGITPFRIGYRVATIAFGLAGAALAIGIHRAIGGSARATVIALPIFALTRAAISWFPMDAPAEPRTSTGTRHGLLAIAAFASLAYAAVKLGGVLDHAARWHSLAAASTILGWGMTATLLAMALTRSHPALRARFGAIERGFYLLGIGWTALFAFACAAALS